VTNGSSDNLSFLKGAGDSTFAAKVDYGLGSSPIGLALGQFAAK